jgi:hypothetical protein
MIKNVYYSTLLLYIFLITKTKMAVHIKSPFNPMSVVITTPKAHKEDGKIAVTLAPVEAKRTRIEAFDLPPPKINEMNER